MKIQKLPEGHSWEVEKITYEGDRTLLIIWKHAKGFHTDHVAVKPRWWWLGYWRCYFGGLRRLRQDKRSDRRAARQRIHFDAASLAAQSIQK